MSRNPTRAEIEELAAFLAVFTAEGFDPILEWAGGELLPDGARTFPWPVYHPAVEEFFMLAGREPWCDYDYRLKNAVAMLQDPAAVQTATLEQIKTLLTCCVRGERFCDGHWGAVIQEGQVQRILERLEVILQDM